MKRLELALLASLLIPAAHADTITFNFPAVALNPPVGPRADPVMQSFTIPAFPSPIPSPSPIFSSPDTFWTALGPGPNPELMFFSSTEVGYVLASDTQYIRAYHIFATPQLYTGTAGSPTLVPGVYTGDYDAPVFGFGFDLGTVTITADDVPGSPVPEPGALTLLATGASGLLYAAGKRRPV